MLLMKILGTDRIGAYYDIFPEHYVRMNNCSFQSYSFLIMLLAFPLSFSNSFSLETPFIASIFFIQFLP